MSKHDFCEFKGSQYEGISLGKVALRCAMSSTHRLAGHKNLKFSDLIGEEVRILKHTWSNVHAMIINEIVEKLIGIIKEIVEEEKDLKKK